MQGYKEKQIVYSWLRQPDLYMYHFFTAHKPGVVAPEDKSCSSRSFPFRPCMFPTQALEDGQLSFLLQWFGSSFRWNVGGRDGAHVCVCVCVCLKYVEGGMVSEVLF